MGVETGGCPHTAIREDCLDQPRRHRRDARGASRISTSILIESGGDNLAATFSPELADLTIYVIDVSGGEKIPRKGGPGITRSDLLVINKIDLAPYVGARPRGDGPRRQADARRAALRLHQCALGRGRRVVAEFIEAGRRAESLAPAHRFIPPRNECARSPAWRT